MRTSARITLLLICCFAAMAPLACDSESELHVEEGQELELGELSYEIQITRFLNRADPEDSAYLRGQPAPPPGQDYLATFVQIENHGSETATLPQMTIRDTRENVFEPVPSDSIFALDLDLEVEGGAEIPPLDSAAANSVIQGAMVLFLIDEGATENRPLELFIAQPGPDGIVELDI